jgi:hypothetical protein
MGGGCLHEDPDCTRDCCKPNDNSLGSKFRFTTKDVTVRGKGRVVRASYLAENSKFETDIIKYMEKKETSDVPDRVVDMLVEFINHEGYRNEDILDEVTLCILANAVGVKSALENAVGRLKKLECGIRDCHELTSIVATIMLSSKVDSKVKSWLKEYLEKGLNFDELRRSLKYVELIGCHPQIDIELLQMLGQIPEKKLPYRVL